MNTNEIFDSEDEVKMSSAAAVALLNEVEDEEAIELDDDDLEGLGDDNNDSMLEPQVILENDDLCQVCQGPLTSHFGGQPCGSYDSSSNTTGHFLFDDSNESNSEQLNSQNNVKRCIVCNARNPSREHLANHFIQELVEGLQGQTQCAKCDFQAAGTSNNSSNSGLAKSLALHDVADHDGAYLDQLMQDAPLVSSKRADLEARGHRQSLGPQCPICDQQMHKSHSRDHVSWHFMEELREMISEPTKCPECSYIGDKLEAVSRHVALFHCKLDEFLQDEQLVAAKRAKAMSRPKRVTIGPTCPICGIKDPAREHVSRHFMNELMESVADLDDPLQCPECSYRGEKSQNVARHIALVHSRLDALLANDQLVETRRQQFMSRPNKINIGAECPVCDQQLTKQHSRVHVIWHFIEELREIVHTFADPTRCDFCTYMNSNSDKVVKHIALGHSKLDEMLQDDELLERKRIMARTKPKRENIGPVCPICDVRDPPREHVARHFGDELNDFVHTLKDQLSCTECNYRGEKPKNLGLHIALVHGRLDFYLKNKKLVRGKKSQFMSQPKKQNIGPQCPICDLTFTKSQNRDHVAWHFIDELREFVQSFPDPTKCWKCDYVSEKMDNLVKHVALGHSKLDELLQNQDLVLEKRAKIMAKPRRVAIGPICPICDARDPAREHVARHFSDELLAIVHQYPDPCACMECEYRGDKPKTVSIHVALVHAKLDLLLQNVDLVDQKRAIHHSKPKKLSIGPTCPVCDLKFTKTQNRDHVSWHYIEELRSIVQEFADPNQCPQCPYTADANEKMVKHVALGHSMLDALLQDESLLEHKRQKAMNKPKKVQVGSTCPICDTKDPSREHVSRHFSDELLDIVMGFDDPNQCTQCNYKNDKPKNVSIHIALVHSILDHFLSDGELVKSKRDSYHLKPQKVVIGLQCPICDAEFAKGQNRDHVCWHFMDELRDIVLAFPDTTMCNECTYSSDKLDNLVKHVALGHSKLDQLLSNNTLVAEKREVALNKPKKINIGPNCPICDLKFTKAQNRDHVSWHFMDELRDYVHSTGSDRACQLCYYTTDKMDNLVKHYALGHSKLDELLLDTHLVHEKRAEHAKKPKRMSFGPDCPICLEKNRDRDHVSRHFMDELMEIVLQLSNKKHCNLCTYKSHKREYMAKHIALFHCKLDELMADEELVKDKQEKALQKPKRISMGENCIICGVTFPQREHVCRHFLEELLEIVNTFDSPLSCAECPFTADKSEYVARHVGLVHRKLDEMICDSELVARKIAENNGTTMTSTTTTTTLTTTTRSMEPVRKSQRQSKPINRGDDILFGPPPPTTTTAAELNNKRKSSGDAGTTKSEKSPVPAKAPKLDINPAIISEESTSDGGGDDLTCNKMDHDETTTTKESPTLKLKIKPPPMTISEDIKDESMDVSDYDSDGSNQSADHLTTTTNEDLKPPISLVKTQTPTSLLKSTLLKPVKTNQSAAAVSKMPPLSSLLKSALPAAGPKVPGNILMNSLLKPVHQASAVQVKPKKIVPLPASITLTPKVKVASLLKQQKPLLLPPPTTMTLATAKRLQLDSVSIADINNSWAESLMSSNPTPKPKPAAPQLGQHQTKTSASEWSSFSPPNANTIKTIGSCTLTPATGINKTAKTSVSSVPTISLLKITPSHSIIAPSVTLTPSTPGSKASKKNKKWQIKPTATITPLNQKTSVKPMFPSQPLDRSTLFGGAALPRKVQQQQSLHPLIGKPLVSRQTEHMIVTPELINDQDDSDDQEPEEMIFEPQIFLDDDDEEEEVEEEEEEEEVEENNAAQDDQIMDEFCDLCSMELEHHPDTNPCPPYDGFVKEYKSCPICDCKEPTREHVFRHFLSELKEVVEAFEDPLACTQCDYQSEKTSTDIVALHIALNHDAIKPYLTDLNLIQSKRNQISSSARPPPKLVQNNPKNNHSNSSQKNVNFEQHQQQQEKNKPRIQLGSECPICEFKEPSREHVSRHFMNELLDHVASLNDHLQCQQCNYRGEKPQNLAKHIALVHNMLDDFLQNEELLEYRRNEARAKPKKISIGSTCPVCMQAIQKRDSRVHVIWHFMEELRELVQEFPDPTMCNYCPYTNPNPDKMAKHMALGHSKLDELLSNSELVAIKQQKALSKPKKLNIGPQCPICGMQFTKSQNRDHVSWHFMDELRDYVQTFPDPQQCNQCEYRSDKIDNLVKHLALGHSKLDELLLNRQLVDAKKQLAKAKPKKVAIGPNCPICDMAFTKSQNRDHVSWHFMDELRTIVNNEFDDPQACNQCEYRTEKMDNLVKHLALGHSKLDEFLMDDDLVANKRMQYHTSSSSSSSTTATTNNMSKSRF